ncbi:dTDP-glucose 4,6-dehydratase [Novispirillum itersonii]|uniref:dTDP-glucose 4,6-dehydratase n=1 Tax=Novispirillum itersonii TaxID=189 RepID=UPI0003616607|nr:dTDP-glucose 4,6-dehydratase [Novispirillum itersonii]
MEVLLVTGAAGFVGSQFVRTALEQGYAVIGLDKLTYAGSPDNVAGLPADRFELVVGDIADYSLVRSLLERHRPSGVLNFAAESHVDRSISGPDAFIETNVLGTMHILRAASDYHQTLTGGDREGFRFVQISTDEVFGSLGEEGFFTETTPYAPRSPYSASKAGADHLASAWHHTYGLPTIVTHCSNNYGPRQHPEKLIPHMITCALAGKQLPVYGTGQNIRDWIHVEDHCAGVMVALQRGRVGEHYCFGGQSEWRNIDLVTQICTILDRIRPRSDKQSYTSQISMVTDRMGHDYRYAIDIATATRELDFTPQVTFPEGLASTVEWYLDASKMRGQDTP